MRDILVCTVGTSLFSNLRSASPHDKNEMLRGVCQAFSKKNWIALGKELLGAEPQDHLCGAEINSTASILEKGKVTQRSMLVLLASDTDDGRDTGEVLRHYYREARNAFRFDDVRLVIVAGLQHSDAKVFRNVGLRNLVREIGRLSREFGSARIAINATGGYKAQISFAGLIGQALEIPVYYMFESFNEVIELPPQPVTMDFDLWLDRYELFQRLDREKQIENGSHIKDERLHALVDEEVVDGTPYLALSPVGQLFHEGFRYRFQRYSSQLLPPGLSDDKRKHPASDPGVTQNQHLNHLHLTGLIPLLSRIFESKRYVLGFHCYYTNPDLSKETCFKVGHEGERPCVKLVYSERGKTAELEVETGTAGMEEIKAAAVDLSESFCH